MSDIRESKLSDLVKGQSTQTSSNELKARVENLARQHDSASRHRRAHIARIRFALAAGVSGIAAIGLIALSPSLAAAHTLNNIVAAVDGANSMHFRQVDVSKAAPLSSFEEWYQDGSWRMQRGNGETTVYKAGISYTYTPSTNTVIKKTAVNGPFSHPTGFKMSSILGGITGTRRTPNVIVTNLSNGTYRLQVDNTPVHERYLFTVDSKTDLPKTMDVEKQENGTWVVKCKGTIEFNSSLSADLFKPNFPGSAKKIDLDRYKKDLAKQFEKEVATAHVDHGHAIVIRDVEANSRGHVFVVYSGASLNFTEWGELTDERGTHYLKCDMVNQGNFPDRDLDLGNGKSIKFQWWIPVEESPTFHPTRFTFVVKKQPHIPLKKPAGAFTPGPITEIGRTTFSIAHPSVADIPLYLPLTGGMMLPQDEIDVRTAEISNLCKYLQRVWVDRSGKPVPGLLAGGMWEFSTKTTGNRRDRASLEKAYRLAQAEVELNRQNTKFHDDGHAGCAGLIDLFETCTLLGRTKEASATLEAIRQTSPTVVKDELKWVDYEKQIGNLPH